MNIIDFFFRMSVIDYKCGIFYILRTYFTSIRLFKQFLSSHPNQKYLDHLFQYNFNSFSTNENYIIFFVILVATTIFNIISY